MTTSSGAARAISTVSLHGPSAVEELLERLRREPSAAVRQARGNGKKGPDAYRLADRGPDLARIRNYFADGYTIVLDNVERYVRTMGPSSHSVEVELNFPTQVNAYVTPPESRGFVPDYDEHDDADYSGPGSKTWHLTTLMYCPRDGARREAVDAAGLPSPIQLRLEAGDVLYLPRGRVHGAEKPGLVVIAALDHRNSRTHRAYADDPGHCIR